MADDFNTLPVSVVIPTLGGNVLLPTLEKLNGEKKIPKEILICIPSNFKFNNSILDHPNVKLIQTSVTGQVAQRAEGFRFANQHFVLQLDDDVLLADGCLEFLINMSIKHGDKVVVAPTYFDKDSNNCIHKHELGLKGFISNFAGWFVCGAPWGIQRMGKISKASTNYGVDGNLINQEYIEVDWLPGGCCLHQNHNLCKDNFYPFLGKAYCEDLIHSVILKKKNLRLLIFKDAKCSIDAPKYPTDTNSIFADFRARNYLNQLHKGSKLRLWIWCVITLLMKKIK